MTQLIHPSDMTNLIQAFELLSLQQHENLVLIDARAGVDAQEKYLAQHLQGALWADLEQHLAQKTGNPAQGGRHPLPDAQQFNQLLSGWGIGPEDFVVVYDDKNGANAAARFWWMAKSIGQERVLVLDGGYAAALAAGYPTSSGAETPGQAERPPVAGWRWPLADIEEVGKAAQDPVGHLVIDVREKDRFDGLREPIDATAGHIPGAVNIPYAGNLDEAGHFLPASALHSKYREALGDRPASRVVVHCGSGVTACHTLLALLEAGLELPKLYVGSWSEWSRTGREIGKGPERH